MEISTIHFSSAIPLLRIFSEDKAREFYVDFLGFTIDWEHRFDAGFPLYAQIHRGELELHLTEHHGDASPGSTVFVPTLDIDALHEQLNDKDYKFAKPAIIDLPWGRQIEVADPFGNRLRFCELKP